MNDLSPNQQKTASDGAAGLPAAVKFRTESVAPNRLSYSLDGIGLKHGLVSVAEGVRLHYVVAGVGEPVLLVPGWPQSWFAWRFVIPLLVKAGRQVYAIDPRGFGDSDKPQQGYDLDTASDDIHAFIGALDLAGDNGIDIIGHDVGSWITHAHATAYPEDVRRLIITDATIPGISPLPGGGYPDQNTNIRSWHFGFNRVDHLPELLIQGREKEFLTWFFGRMKCARLWAIDEAAFQEFLRVFSAPGAVRSGLMYYREVFTAVGQAKQAERKKIVLNMPILAVGGEDADAQNTVDTMMAVGSDVRGAVIPAVGHHLPEECPDELVALILEFWDTVKV